MFKFCSKPQPKFHPAPLPLSENKLHEETFQALLTEYSCLRAEAQHDDTHQIELVTITFSALVALVAAAAAFQKAIPQNVGIFLSFVAFPCLVMFMGLLWIDLIYRRTRFGGYTKKLENKINALLKQNQDSSDKIMEWEHWTQDLEDGTGFFHVTRYFRGYIVSGSWLIAPFLVMGPYLLLAEGSPSEAFSLVCTKARAYFPVTLFMLVIYAIYFIFFYLYLKKIKNFPKQIP